MQNFAFGIIYLVQAVLVYNYPDYEYLEPERMFISMFSLMFGVFAYVQAFAHVQDKDKALMSARAMFELIFTRSEINAMSTEGKSIPHGSLQGRIEFRNVWFRYPERRGQWVFKGLNLIIEPNEIVAVVGESGAGKSTFINLIMRFYNLEEGQILIDGVDVKEYNVRDLRRQMGLVMQEPTLFNYSIKENILYGTLDASNQQIKDAVEVANAAEFIETDELVGAFDDKPASVLKAMTSPLYEAKLRKEMTDEVYDEKLAVLTKMVGMSGGGATGGKSEKASLIDNRTAAQKGDLVLHDGYDVSCGVKGSKLSGGQKQRVAIARAVVRNPKILLLDEATSALDEISQRKVQDALQNVMKGRTSIVVAHRMTTVEQCTRVAVLQDGKIVEQGAPSSLRQEGGHFAALAAGMA